MTPTLEGCSTPNMAPENGDTSRITTTPPVSHIYFQSQSTSEHTNNWPSSKFRTLSPDEPIPNYLSTPTKSDEFQSSQPIPIQDSPRAVFLYHDDDNDAKEKERERYNRSTWKMYHRIVESRPSRLTSHDYYYAGTSPHPHESSGLEETQEINFDNQRDELSSSDEFMFELDL